MSAPASRSRGGHEEEEHENHERWLVSYADMITVLMALFIVLFAISQVDQKKFIEFKTGLAAGAGANSQIPVTGGTGLMSTRGMIPNPVGLDVDLPPSPVNLVDAAEESGAQGQARAEGLLAAAQAELDRLEQIRAELGGALEERGLADRVRFRITDRGLVAAVVADDVFFASASADIQPRGVEVLQAVAPVLAALPEEIAVEGHANHLKISSARYPTNWELSASRAASVVRYLADSGAVNPLRLSATGFGDTRPLFPIDDPAALSGNRRVDLVIVDQKSPEIRALIPQLAEARGIAGTPEPHPEPAHTAPAHTEPAAPEAAAHAPDVAPAAHTEAPAQPAAQPAAHPAAQPAADH